MHAASFGVVIGYNTMPDTKPVIGTCTQSTQFGLLPYVSVNKSSSTMQSLL